jgi:transaldolase
MATSTEIVVSPLQEMASSTETDYWNDSCSVDELTYAVARGATGATSNPTIVGEVLRKELHLWHERILEIVRENPTWTEDDVTWRLNEEMAVRGAEILLPVFEREGGRKGRLSIQTNPRLYRDPARLVEQALHFGGLAPNIQVKIPATSAGIEAVEEVTAAGVSINATVSFTVPQALAVADAVERGLRRREEAGEDVSQMSPVVTMMVGRLDDWLQVLVDRDGILATPGTVNWAGIACVKRAYPIFQERRYRARLLAAAYRHRLHWTELVGGDVVLTMPHAWQRRFNAWDGDVVPRMDEPVPADVLDELRLRFEDFRRAYEPDGLTRDEFDAFGPTVRTLRSFIASYQDLVATVRGYMLPDPDLARR